jgi:hypothetical protein
MEEDKQVLSGCPYCHYETEHFHQTEKPATCIALKSKGEKFGGQIFFQRHNMRTFTGQPIHCAVIYYYLCTSKNIPHKNVSNERCKC